MANKNVRNVCGVRYFQLNNEVLRLQPQLLSLWQRQV